MSQRSFVLKLFLASFFYFSLVFPIHSQNNIMNGSINFETILNHSFENPNPAPWTINGAAGSVNYPSAPDGNRVLYIRGFASASQSISVANDGCYRVDVQTALFNVNNPNGLRIFIDGVEIMDKQATATSFSTHFSVGHTLTAGTHTLTISGTAATSNIILVDNIQLAKLPCWSDASIWSQNSVPDAKDTALIAAQSAVVLDIDGICSHLRSQGKVLVANQRSINLDAEMIMMMSNTALLEWGQENTPYEKDGVLTLHGDIAQAQAGKQTAALMVMGGAQLQMHGQKREAWTQIDTHAEENATQITTKEKTGWKEGDVIVIASTDFNPHQAEVRTISQISGGGTTFHFNTPLMYHHYGNILSYPDNPNGVELDQRAEVGLLSRNLKIQGDADASVDKAGGHIMIMEGSFAQVSGVELYQMGQEGILGRYPFHWHLTGDISGQYLKNSSIHVSFNRVVTVHSSSNGLIENNVAYDHIGNGYFLENGDEVNNRFINNLGILTRAAIPGKEVRIYDRLPADNKELPFLRLPATFWITHPSNDFIGNVSAGSEGSGFWMTVQHAPIEGNNPNNIFPRLEPLGQFDDNVSHSTSFSNFAIDLRVVHDIGPDTHKIVSSGNYLPPNTPIINRFTSYKCRDRAIWMRTNSLDFEQCASGDNGRSTFFSYHNVIKNSLYVGKSDNVGTPSTWSANETLVGRSLPIPEWPIEDVANHFRGHPLYDGPSGVENCHFADFYGDNASIFVPNTAATKSTVHFAQEMTYTNVPKANKFSNLFSQDRDFQWTTGLIDLDGSIDPATNKGDFIKPRIQAKNDPDRRLYDAGFNVETGATFVPEWDAYVCTEEHYGLMLLFNDLDPARKNPIYSIRSDGFATITEGQDSKHQIPVIVNNNDYRYYFQYHRMPDTIQIRLKHLLQDDVVTFVLLNVPSSSLISKLGGSISAFTSQSAFESSNNEGYYFDNNTLYVRLKGSDQHNIAHFGHEFPYASNLKICQHTGCQKITPAGTFEVPLADYENGLDERATLSTSGNLNLGNISANMTGAYNSFDLTSDGDGLDEYLEYRLDFHRQAWSEFNNLVLDYSGPRVQVLLHDQSEGIVPLGFYQPTTCDGLDLTRLAKEEVDQVDAILLRVYESDLGDLQQSGLSATIQIQEILLDHARDLWDFHRNAEDWIAVQSSNINSVNDGILNFSKTNNSGAIRNDLFFGRPAIQPNSSTSLVMRMKPISSQGNVGQFAHLPWGTDWVSGPIFNLGTFQQFNQYIIQPTWHSSLDVQRIKFNLLAGTQGEADIDYIRITDCPTCYNGLLDPGETDIDCGGPDCISCPCEDGIQNNGETGIDCGGPCQDCSQLVFENGLLQNIDDTWVTVNTQHTYNNMVIIATPLLPTANDEPIVTRIRNVGNNSFDIRVQNPSGLNSGSQDVYYFLIEEGIYTEAIDGIKMEAWTDLSTATAGKNNWIFENRTLSNAYTNPVVMGQVQSFNDSNWSVFWASAMGIRNAPPAAGNQISAGKHVGEDTQSSRADENLGFVVLEAGLYELNGQVLEAGVGADNINGVQGLQVFPPIVYSLSNQVDLEGAVLSSAGMDGGDGGWPILFSNTAIQPHSIQPKIDEDKIADPERSHTTEQVAYLAFGQHAGGGALRFHDRTNDQTIGKETSDIHLFPNPMGQGQTLFIESPMGHFSENSVIDIFSLEGRDMPLEQIKQTSDQIAIEVNLPPGLYFVSIVERGIRTVKKLFVNP